MDLLTDTGSAIVDEIENWETSHTALNCERNSIENCGWTDLEVIRDNVATRLQRNISKRTIFDAIEALLDERE